MEFSSRNCNLFIAVLLTVIINLQVQLAGGIIGANYGMSGDNLPPPKAVIGQYQDENILLITMYEPNRDVLDALRGTVIKVALGVKNEDVTDIAMNTNTAQKWVNSIVAPYIDHVDIEWITVGNDIVPGPTAKLIPQAMNNILSGLNSAGITRVKVSTVVNANVVTVYSPPSEASFRPEAMEFMKGIVTWLAGTDNPIFINVYPYSAIKENPSNIPLDFALFKASQPVIDGKLKYYSLFEAMVDSFYAALEKIGGDKLKIVVAETGWPSAGNQPYTTKQNAQQYNQNLIDKMTNKGTPRKQSNILDTFIYAMYNENKKPGGGVEQNWGLHYPNMESVYPLSFRK